MSTYRLMSLDGGVCAPTYLRCLREIERQKPGFLARTDAFSGVSDGAVSSVALTNPTLGSLDLAHIERAIEIEERVINSLRPVGLDWLRLISGLYSMTNGDALVNVLDEELGAETRLGSLERRVVLFGYGIEGLSSLRVMDSANPEYENLTSTGAVLRSGSFPVALPIAHGCIDGGLFANNASMTALAYVIGDKHESCRIERLEDLRCFSLGFGSRRLGTSSCQRDWQHQRTEWGYGSWFFRCGDPLLFPQALFNSQSLASNFQARQMLGPSFFRVQIPSRFGAISGVAAVLLGHLDDVVERAEEVVYQWVHEPESATLWPSFKETLEWVDEYW